MSQLIKPNMFDTATIRSLPLQTRGAGNPGTKNKIEYKDVICALDIETSRIKSIEQSFMYLWQFQFGLNYTVMGRYWEDLLRLFKRISSCLNDGQYICIFVHNLSYEFQFLRGIYPFSPREVFAIDSRKVLKCTMFDHLELRCSYIHSNMSLKEYTHKMRAAHPKLDGDEFGYDIVRYPWTELSEKETEYATNDVLGLVESIIIDMEHENDNLYTFPLTSTGYVRRDAKRAMKNVSHTFVRGQLANYKIYQMLREAFRGGNTHANRYYAGVVLHNVKSADRVSSYPEVLCNCLFPVSEFYEAGIVTYDELLELINVRKKAVLMRVSITKLRLHNKYWGAPYLSRDKCRNIHNALYDNGRILEADYLETTLTDIDFKIIINEYDFDDFTTFDVAHARYGKLPRPLIEMIIRYFETKTELKGVTGQEIYYTKAKNKTNSIYGMMAQDPVKQSIDFIDDEFKEHTDDAELLLNLSNKKAFLCYQWGVWTTAHSRYELEQGIILAGEGFVYSDTDSVKHLDDIDWTTYNNAKIKASKESGAFATDQSGYTHYMGVYEQEKGYHEFCTLGAKKYCFRHEENGPLEITIAGVTKKKGGKELEKHGGIAAFRPGFVFRDAGGTEAVYNDNPEIDIYNIEGKQIKITSNVVIRESTYTLGITAEYERLLELSKINLDNM